MWPQLAGIHRSCITKKWLLEVGPFEHELPKLLKAARNTHHSFYLLSHPPHIVEGERQAATETEKEVERQKEKLCNWDGDKWRPPGRPPGPPPGPCRSSSPHTFATEAERGSGCSQGTSAALPQPHRATLKILSWEPCLCATQEGSGIPGSGFKLTLLLQLLVISAILSPPSHPNVSLIYRHDKIRHELISSNVWLDFYLFIYCVYLGTIFRVKYVKWKIHCLFR